MTQHWRKDWGTCYSMGRVRVSAYHSAFAGVDEGVAAFFLQRLNEIKGSERVILLGCPISGHWDRERARLLSSLSFVWWGVCVFWSAPIGVSRLLASFFCSNPEIYETRR